MQIGDRVHVGSRRASVRYIGPIDGYSGDWLGLEWDEVEGGKHNGTVNGRSYFVTTHPTNGSFVRLGKVDCGVSLTTAIADRYNDTASKFQNEGFIFGSHKEIELVGMEKTSNQQKDIYNLQSIVLDNQFVSKPPDVPPTSEHKFLRCRELNLYNNLLHRWSDIQEILRYFPILEELVLRKNVMDNVEQIEPFKSWCVQTLKNLVLSDCGVTSITISAALSWMPSVTNLYALRNSIRQFEPIPQISHRLEVLDLEGNPLGSFKNVCGKYESLTKLSVVNCGLEDVDNSIEDRFPKLRHLNLLQNSIKEWASIQMLCKLPSLATLFIGTSELHVPTKSIGVHEVIVATIPQLTDLNRFDVKVTERRSAEIRFINTYSNLPQESRVPHQSDIDRLVAIHGPPVLDTTKKGLSLIQLKISSGSSDVEKKLPLSIAVCKLHEMLCRMFAVDPLSTRLELEKGAGYFVDLDNPSRPFRHYSPEVTDILRIVPS